MKKIILVLLFVGCQKFEPIKCNYCHGFIFYHKISSDQLVQSFDVDNKTGKKYHFQCIKIMELENKINKEK